MNAEVFGSPVEQQKRASVKEGQELARIYLSSPDLNTADQKIHERLLVDAFMASHGEFNMVAVKKTLVEEVNKQKEPSRVLKQDLMGNISRQGFVLPLVGWDIGGKTIFDGNEANKVIGEMDSARAAKVSAEKQASTPHLNIFDGAMGNADLIRAMVNRAN